MLKKMYENPDTKFTSIRANTPQQQLQVRDEEDPSPGVSSFLQVPDQHMQSTSSKPMDNLRDTLKESINLRSEDLDNTVENQSARFPTAED